MKSILGLYSICITYSVIRYIVFAPKNIEHLPIFIVNKGWSMAAALSFVFGFFQQMRKDRGATLSVEPSAWFRAGVYGSIAHIPMSLAILRPGYFKEFFIADGARMSFYGEMVFLFGGITAACVYLLTRTHWTPILRWRLSLLTMLTLATHVTFMGICRGLNINKSHAYMPPMWLLSLIGVALGLWWLVRSKPTNDNI
ncbi:MAG: hypothetical protein WD768_10970 [Phycisphaeraceae bacterium]